MARTKWFPWCMGMLCLACGCSHSPGPPAPASAGVPLGLQMVRSEEQLRKYPFFTLLSFESEADPVFVKAEGSAPSRDDSRAHTGTSALRLEPGTRSITIKLASLHSGREWPGPWTLVGAYLFAPQPQRLSIVGDAAGKPRASYTVEIPAGRWTPVLLDLSTLVAADAQDLGTLRFSFEQSLTAPIWVDDVLEVNNATVHVQSSSPAWSVQERGFRFIVAGNGFEEVMPTPEAAADGWTLAEANGWFARFLSRTGQQMRTIYCDGREYNGTGVRLLNPASGEAAALSRQHAQPASITIATEMGRVDRNSAGDANNDGYAEASGTYQIVAASPRLELRITPRTAALVRPLLQVRGLPAGPVLINMEGRLVERSLRLGDGSVLVEIPGSLEKPTMLNIRVGGG